MLLYVLFWYYPAYLNDFLGNVSDMGNKTQNAFFSNYDEKFMSAAELIDENSEYIKHYFKVRNMHDSTRKDHKFLIIITKKCILCFISHITDIS